MKKSLKKKREIVKVVVFLLMFTSIQSNAQGNIAVDEIPHDISYYRETKIAKPLVKAVYGRPSHTGNNEVFGTKVPFNELWRTGANEATEIRFYNNVVFGDTIVEAGTYVLYTIPGEHDWEVILNSNTDVIGAFQYDAMFDVAKIKVPVRRGERLETFAISFRKHQSSKIIMTLGWGSTRVNVPLGFETNVQYASTYDATKKKAIMN